MNRQCWLIKINVETNYSKITYRKNPEYPKKTKPIRDNLEYLIYTHINKSKDKAWYSKRAKDNNRTLNWS